MPHLLIVCYDSRFLSRCLLLSTRRRNGSWMTIRNRQKISFNGAAKMGSRYTVFFSFSSSSSLTSSISCGPHTLMMSGICRCLALMTCLSNLYCNIPTRFHGTLLDHSYRLVMGLMFILGSSLRSSSTHPTLLRMQVVHMLSMASIGLFDLMLMSLG